ncbi:hypothetical protein [Bosea sp. MMO-172]|uniref:hypothetical protein n=1 Tax=Bosea sp. MMO-172 TaxID=3127885 RepID=UPI0030198F1E
MPFSTLTDPVDLARAQAALESVWAEVQDGVPADRVASERIRLSYIIANLAPVALDEDELVQKALDRFRTTP